MTLTQADLEKRLWRAADILRGQIDAADYKNYIFSLLFLKRLSDRFGEEVEEAVARGVPRSTALHDADEHEFFVPESARWPAIVADSRPQTGETLNAASYEIEDANAPRLNGVLTGTNWNDETKLGSPANRERIVRSLLNHFGELDLSDANLRPDGEAGPSNVLGDAYEFLVGRFADQSGRKGGEDYTPRGVVRLIVELLHPTEGMRICDPLAGSGGMLIYAAQYLVEQGGDQRNLVLHGQERNLGTLAIAKLNLLLHGLRAARLEAGDVIAEPRLLDPDGRLISYDRVIANPPFSEKDWGREIAAGDAHRRFARYGVLPPKSKGDFAFLLHMLAVTAAGGMTGVVMPNGVLSRGNSEAKIRRGLVEDDLFEVIVGLPPKLFRNTQIPVTILVLNKNKPPERRGKVLFVDANREGCFREERARNFLDPEHVRRIAAAGHAFEDKKRFAHVAELAEIEANDWNLSVHRYVDDNATPDVPDIGDALASLRAAEAARDTASERMHGLLTRLGYAQ